MPFRFPRNAVEAAAFEVVNFQGRELTGRAEAFVLAVLEGTGFIVEA